MDLKRQPAGSKILREQNGWTLIELVTVMATIGMLAAMSMNYAIDFLRTTRDTAAMSDAQNIMTIVYKNFTSKDSVNYNATENFNNRLAIGTETAAGVARPPVFTLSPDVKLSFDPSDTNRSYADGTPGFFHGWFFHPFGSKDRLALCSGPNTEGRRCFEVWVDEGDNISEILIW